MDKRIHKFKQGDHYILMDINSGSVHIIDDVAYNMLDYLTPPLLEQMPIDIGIKMSDFSEITILECYSELFELYKSGMLFSDDSYEKYAEANLNAPIKALCLHVSHDCNLRCKYCFAETGDFGTGRKIMTPETAKKAIDFLIEKSVGRENLEVDFFGGEPLMAWETVVETVKYARSIEKKHNKNIRFTITTNGIGLDDEKIKYINEEMSNCVLSLDGRKEINDLMRPAPNGKGSYDIIVPKYKKLVAERKKQGKTDYYIRGTFTKNNLDFVNDVLHIHDLGFKEISIEPVVTDSNLNYAITEKDLPKIFDEYDKLFDIMATKKHKFNFFHFMIDLEQGPCAIKRLRGCGCGNEYVAITPDGDIFPCHQFVGIDKWKMGNIYNSIVDEEIKEYFAKTHIYSKKDCKDCFARFYCSGGCNANSYIYEGDARIPNKIACELQKKRTECAVALACLRSL